MPNNSTHIKTKILKLNNQKYIGFYLTELYTNKSLNKLINEVKNFNHLGLTYFNQNDLPKSILQVL
jgi:hypothetical protein